MAGCKLQQTVSFLTITELQKLTVMETEGSTMEGRRAAWLVSVCCSDVSPVRCRMFRCVQCDWLFSWQRWQQPGRKYTLWCIGTERTLLIGQSNNSVRPNKKWNAFCFCENRTLRKKKTLLTLFLVTFELYSCFSFGYKRQEGLHSFEENGGRTKPIWRLMRLWRVHLINVFCQSPLDQLAPTEGRLRTPGIKVSLIPEVLPDWPQSAGDRV